MIDANQIGHYKNNNDHTIMSKGCESFINLYNIQTKRRTKT